MKKLIAISVVFALVAGAVFAADVSGTVIGTVNVIKGDNGDGTPVTSGGEMNRIRVEVSGANDDETFGGYIRLDPASLSWDDKKESNGVPNPGYGKVKGFGNGVEGIAWWKPIDQLKFSIGGNSDGMFGKEGVTGWMFNQTAADTGVTFCGDNVWTGSGLYGYGLVTRNAFYGGFAGQGAILNITPAEIVDINIAIPFISGDVVDGKNSKADEGQHEAADYFKAAHFQLDFKLDFGNIAITYSGGPRYYEYGDGSVVFAYFGLTAIENLSLDVGLGFEFNNQDSSKNPIAAGFGLKYAVDAFGIKVRTIGRFGGEDKTPTVIQADLLPFYNVSDSVRAFFGIGLGVLLPDSGDTLMGFNVNPYLEVGQEWGPKFVAGIKVLSLAGDAEHGKYDKSAMTWSVPIALSVSF